MIISMGFLVFYFLLILLFFPLILGFTFLSLILSGEPSDCLLGPLHCFNAGFCCRHHSSWSTWCVALEVCISTLIPLKIVWFPLGVLFGKLVVWENVVNIPRFFPLLIPSFILLWSEIILGLISIFLNILRFVLCPNI